MIQGRQQYLWRAVDQDGDVIDILVQPRRDRRAAARFFRNLLKGQGRGPLRLITDKLRSYSAAHRAAMPSFIHSTRQYENNRAEVSLQTHAATRATDAAVQIRRACPTFSLGARLVQNLFRGGRHLLGAVHHSLLLARAFGVWRDVT
jgi:putative transposase